MLTEGNGRRHARISLLHAARVAWPILAMLVVALCLSGLPAFYRHLTTIAAATDLQVTQLSARDVQTLRDADVSLEAYAVYRIAVHLISALSFWVVAAIIYWRKAHEGIGLLVSVMLLLIGANRLWPALVALRTAYPTWGPLVNLVWAAGWPMLILFLYFFPDGRCVPRWMRVPAVGASLLIIAWDIATGAWGGPFNGLLMMGLFVAGMVAQIYRYARVSDRVQRQQTKWVVAGVAALLAVTVAGGTIPAFYVPGTSSFLLVGSTMTSVGLAFVPLSIGVAILRYRLYDIDVIINRTLVYGTLTALLALIYFGSVVLLQQVSRHVIGPDNTLAIVASTLIIAALFRPLRGRVQAVIDCRFYRRKYDAVKTLAAFNTRLRDEVDLGMLSDDLIGLVDETLQPSHVSLWLRAAPDPRPSKG